MTSHCYSNTPSARVWLKWLANAVGNKKVTDCLKDRVLCIRQEGEPTGFAVTLEVNGEYARKILTMKLPEIQAALAQGYREQGGFICNGISLVIPDKKPCTIPDNALNRQPNL